MASDAGALETTGDQGCSFGASGVETIESILETRPVVFFVDSEVENGANGEVCGPGHVGQNMGMTVEERVKVHADVYGKKPEESEAIDDRTAAFEREIGNIPAARRKSLQKAVRTYPLLFVSSTHAKLLLHADDFDPKIAASRMVKYWEQREAMFGERAFSDGVFTQPTHDDYVRYYERCVRAAADPDLDDSVKDLAVGHVFAMNKAKIEALDRIIENSPPLQKSAYVEAQKRSPELFGADKKLFFLEREDFIEAKAAVRILKFWEKKRTLFGPNIYHRRITIGDVRTQESFFHVLRLLPNPDKHGRSIFMLNAARAISALDNAECTAESFNRYLWYLLEAAMERKTCRENGIIIFLDYRATSGELSEKLSEGRHLSRSIVFDLFPTKVRALHIIVGRVSWWKAVIASFFCRLAALVRKRVVVHFEINQKRLRVMEQVYGIAADQLPKELGGTYDLESWEEWIEDRKVKGI